MKQQSPPENPILNLVINIFLPVLVLNKGVKFLDANTALLLALSFPLFYGIQDYVRRKHKNYVSLLGVINTLMTGGIAVMKLDSSWFAVKEASLPALLGALVLGSAYTKQTAAQIMFCNPHVLNMELIDAKISSLGRLAQFTRLLRVTTLWLSISFFISAALNFYLAVRIFTAIDANLAVEMKDQILNEQIAQMTWMGFAVIALPLMVFSGALVYFFLTKLGKLAEEPFHNLMKS